MRAFNQAVLVFFILAFVSCQRATMPSSSLLEIKIPSHSEKLSSMSAVDYNLLCFAVNIKGGLIEKKQNSCDIESGIRTGSVSPGSAIKVPDVPTGVNLTFELYGLLRANTGDPCPVVTSDSWNYDIRKVYLVGLVTDYKITKANEELTINLNLPDSSAHLAQQNALPASCNPTPSISRIQNRYLVGALIGSSPTYKFDTRVSFKEEAKELTSANLKIKNWQAGGAP